MVVELAMMAAATLAGTWVQECQMDRSGIARTQTLTFFADGTHVQTFDWFGDERCNEPAFSVEDHGPSLVGPAVPSVGGSFQLDLNVKRIFLSLHRRVDVDDSNAKGYCGGGWVLDQPREVTLCEQWVIAPYEIAKVEGDQLWLGLSDATHDGSTPDRRPTVLGSMPLVRQVP